MEEVFDVRKEWESDEETRGEEWKLSKAARSEFAPITGADGLVSHLNPRLMCSTLHPDWSLACVYLIWLPVAAAVAPASSVSCSSLRPPPICAGLLVIGYHGCLVHRSEPAFLCLRFGSAAEFYGWGGVKPRPWLSF